MNDTMLLRTLKIIGWILFGLLAGATLALVLGYPVMWLWNWLMPELFHLPKVTHWQAVGLLILCHLLFKGQQFAPHQRERRSGSSWNLFAERVRDSMKSLDNGGEAQYRQT